MATKPGSTELNGEQVVSLAAAIPADEMRAIAEGYMGISEATVKNLLYENIGQAEAFNREVIRTWANKNSENQISVSGHLMDI